MALIISLADGSKIVQSLTISSLVAPNNSGQIGNTFQTFGSVLTVDLNSV